MIDNRCADLHADRDTFTITGRAHGDGQVQAGFEGAGAAAAQGHADAGARSEAGRSGPRARCQPADGVELGARRRGRYAGLAAQAAGPTGRIVGGRAVRAVQAAGGRRLVLRLSDRAVDAGPGRRAAGSRVRAGVQHHAGLAAAAPPGIFQPASHGTRDPARRVGHAPVEEAALAGAKKNAAPKAAPSSSSTSRDCASGPPGSRPGRRRDGPRCCSTPSTGSSCR